MPSEVGRGKMDTKQLADEYRREGVYSVLYKCWWILCKEDWKLPLQWKVGGGGLRGKSLKHDVGEGGQQEKKGGGSLKVNQSSQPYSQGMLTWENGGCTSANKKDRELVLGTLVLFGGVS